VPALFFPAPFDSTEGQIEVLLPLIAAFLSQFSLRGYSVAIFGELQSGPISPSGSWVVYHFELNRGER
jgi:hypothetical protein